ncbi:uncharacterized protein N7458_009304 [Penicillium daleae]|uniref:Involucrin repeat protein n=1 Tax=Penicillium daleae TaxID=63821 RepID=A0AAD6BYY2_9EURO|nr:uncharacterized protein N7458_009304 [Penicillium daleae]KAJ5438306.1 hypothetical protein N7458_009304 [Penicillium daleae]
MFKALMGGGRSASTSDARSTTSSSSKTSRRKTDSKSASSRKSSRGDDRDRGLGDLSAYAQSTSGSRRGPPSVAGESVASTYVTAEPDAIEYPDRTVVERTPKRRDSDRDSKSSRRRERDRSESREREKRRSSRRSGDDTYDDDQDRERERDRRDRSRTYSGDHHVPPISTTMPSSVPGAQFAADIAAPGFSQFPMQNDNAMQPPVTTAGYSPGHDTSPAPFDPHVQQQFPGQFPSGTAEPYFPPNNPAGAAADYYGDQGQSVGDQPGVRPQQPAIIPNSQAHLMAASPSANPPPEPSSLGQVGAAAAYFTDDIPHNESPDKPPAGSSSKPPKPGKPSKPSKPNKPSSSSAIPTAAAVAAAAATYGVGHHEQSQAAAAYQQESYSSTTVQQTHSYSQPALTSTSKPPHSHGIGTGIGMAAAGAAAGYMIGHQHHESSPTHSSQYTFQNYEQSSHGSVPPYGAGPSNAMIAAGAVGAAGAAGYAAHNPGFYPHGGLAVQHRHRGPLTKFVDFWRDPEGVGRFEDYTETIGVCKYCFEPGTTSMNAPRKHHYHARRHSADRYSSGSSSRVNKLSRYHSSEDERRSRKRSSKKSSSWLPGMLAGYAAKSIFTGRNFDDSYSVHSGHVSGDRVSSYDREDDRRSYTSRGVVRRSGHSPPREYHSDSKHTRRTRSRSRSSSRSGHHSFVKEAALGAAVGGAALAVAKSSRRSRSRSPSQVQRRKDSSSSTSFMDVSRPSAKSVAGFTSFFTASSENRKKEKKKQRSKKSRSFFSFNSSSSSSLDADLAFGSGFAKKSSKLQKKKKGKKTEDVDAALLGLGATATALAASSHFRNSRSTGQMMAARDTRHNNYTSSATNEDDEWVDAESEDQSSASVSSALAFGASSAESGSDSNSSGGWKWGWGNKKKKKDKKSSKMDAALAAGAGALGGAAIASVARHRDSRPPSEAGSLQQVYPVPTSDPSRFDVAKISSSVASGGQPPLVRPGPIPLQQPQPYTPVSQAVYTTQGSLPGSIPAYSPGAVPPIFANEYEQYNEQFQGSRDASYIRDDASFIERRKPHRSDSSPVFPTQESIVSAPKRRSTTRDQASVSFDLTEEQVERERRLDKRERRSQDDFREEPVQLVDHEEELTREEAERRERRERRKYREEEKRRNVSDKEKDSSSWVEAAAIGAIGAAAASSIVSSRKKHDEDVSEVTSRHRDRRAERRAERRGDSSVISKSDVPEPIEEKVSSVSRDSRENSSSPSRKSPRPAPVHEDYAEFFAPEEVRHSPDQHSRDRDHSRDSSTPEIVEVVPASEREKNNDEPRDDLPQFAQEPYEGRDHLPWPVPRLNFIDPTPPASVNGSVRANSPLVTPVEPVREEEPKEREYQREPDPEPEHEPEREWQRPSTGSRVSWGPHQTHEYEIPSSSEQDPHSPIEEISRDLSMTEVEEEQSKDVREKIDFGNDIEFAAIAAAGAQAAGFDPSVVLNDPTYHTRTSPPGSEDEDTFSPHSKWAVPPQPEQSHGFVEGEIDSYTPSKSRDIEPSVEHVIEEKPFYAEPETFTSDKDMSSPKRRDRGSIAQEVIEQLNGKSPRSGSPEDDVFSMPGGFESVDVPRDVSRDDSRSVVSAPPERESEKSRSKKSRRSGDDFKFPREISSRERDAVSPPEEVEEKADEQKTHRKHRSKHGDSDSFSVDDDARSAITSVDDLDKSERRKHRHRSSRDKDFDDTASIASSPAGAYENDEKSERRKRRSKRDSDAFSVNDDARSAITSIGDVDKSERRKHRHRSSRDRDFDDNASVTSSPARIDETREKRRSKDSKDEKEKDKSGGIIRSIFGSRVSAPEGRTQSNQSSRSSSLEKRPSREAVSEAGVDEERRRRKKRSSRHRSSSGDDKVEDDASDKEGSVPDDRDLEEYRSQRQQKEERRRHKYEEIVESGKRRESEKV